MFTPIQKILPRAINKIGIKTEVYAALICEKYRKLAPQMVHTLALEHTRPKFYRRKTLTIVVENPAWAHQIAVHKKDLLKAINESMGKCVLENIQTKVGLTDSPLIR